MVMTDPYAETDEWPTPHVPAQDRTLTDFPCCEAPAATSDATDGRVSRDNLLLAYDRLSREHVELRAELRALRADLSEGKAAAADVLAAWRRMRNAALAAEARAEAAEAELRALREGLQALADDMEIPAAYTGPYGDGFRDSRDVDAARVRALLASSPAEVVCARCGHAATHHYPNDGCYECGVERLSREVVPDFHEFYPAPVSSGEAATGEAWRCSHGYTNAEHQCQEHLIRNWRLIGLAQQAARDAAPVVAPSGEDMCPNCVTPWKCNGPHVPCDTEGGEGR